MLKTYKVINKNEKLNVNEFFRSIVEPIGHLNLGCEASLNEIIASYVKESTLYKMDETTENLGNAFLSVAILLAFIERISSPVRKPSSVEQIVNSEKYTIEDMIAECTGIVAQSTFEGREDRADEYLLYMAVLTKMLLEEEGFDFSDDDPSSDDDIEDTQSETEEEPVPEEIAVPV